MGVPENVTVLALDISTKTGWSVLKNTPPDPKLVSYGLIKLDRVVASFGDYPHNYVSAAEAMAEKIKTVVDITNPQIVVIEETNPGRAGRYTQKILEFTHLAVLQTLKDQRVFYLNSREWRKISGVALTAEDQRNNRLLSSAKSKSKRKGEKLDKTALGVAGKKNLKHAAVARVNGLFGLDFKVCNNDIADAILLGVGFLKGGKICDGKISCGRKRG